MSAADGAPASGGSSSLPALPSFFVGSYTATGGGTATGISFVQDGVAATVAVMDDPSFLAVSGDRVYAVSEVVGGSVHAFRRHGTRSSREGRGPGLEHLWQASAEGDAPCHVRVDASGVLVLANYTSGTVTAVSVEDPQSVATVVLPDVTGPDQDRQDGPHAHQSTATPWGTVLVADLGGDALHEFAVSSAAGASALGASSPSSSLELTPVRVHHVAPGAGPRHMAWYDGDLFVTGELDGHVSRLRRDESGALRVVATAPTWAEDVHPAGATHVAGASGASLLSHIEVDECGRIVVAVRGRDVIAVLDASDGGLSFVGAVSCGGSWPRHFAQVPGFLLVANERSDAVAVLPVGEDGMPGAPVSQIAVGTPTCVVPV